METDAVAADLQAVLKPIDRARGLPNRAYTSAEWHATERRLVLERTWTAVGHASDVAAGHALPTELAGLPLVMIRDAGGTLRVFHNVCRHRGHRLVTNPCQLRGSVRCPYHRWTYALDGTLRGTPHIGGPGVHETPGFDRAEHPLMAVRAAVWLDMVFVDLSAQAPPFDHHIAPLRERWEAFTGAGGLRRLAAADDDSRLELELRCNWKLAVENYCESYHLPSVHPGLNRYSRLEDHYPVVCDHWGAGQGTLAFDFADRQQPALPRFPDWPAERRSQAEYIALYPNVLVGLQADHAFTIVLRPTAPDRTVESLRIHYVGEEVAGEVYSAARRRALEGWRSVFAEDVTVVEGMQAGRASSAFDGGLFSPVMDVATHHFHRWIARRMASAHRDAPIGSLDDQAL